MEPAMSRLDPDGVDPAEAQRLAQGPLCRDLGERAFDPGEHGHERNLSLVVEALLPFPEIP